MSTMEGKASENILLDAKIFHKRARHILSEWKTSRNSTSEDELFQKADCLFIMVGAIDGENAYQKSTSLQTWLLGVELSQTLIVFTSDKIHIVTSTTKASILENLKTGDRQVPIEIYKRSKAETENIKHFNSILEVIRNSYDGKKIGILTKDKFTGKIVDEWESCRAKADKQFEMVDITAGISQSLSIKDDEELRIMRTASKLSSLVMKNYFFDEIMTILDEEKTVKHNQLAELTDNALFEKSLRGKLKFPSDINIDSLEWCYTPIIQSGGKYDLRSSAVSNNDPLHAGTIVASFGVRYKSYCSNIGRTYLIHPNKSQEKNYMFLLDLQKYVLGTIKDGVKIRDVYTKALNYIKAKRPELEPYFVKNIGFGMGIEFRESLYNITPKNTKDLRSGMVLNLSIGFQGIENPKATDEKSKIYSLLLVDTIRVTDGAPVIFTDCDSGLDEVSFFFKNEEETEIVDKKVPKSPEKKSKSLPSNSAILQTKLRGELRREQQDEESQEQRRRAHQSKLFSQKQAEGLARFGKNADGNKDENKPVFKKFESYKADSKMPKEIKSLRIVVDQKAETIICPIYGLAVPFHITTLKNMSKSDEGEFVILRLNFVTPGQAGSKKDERPFDDPNATFVRALTYRSSDISHLTEIHKSITELKKNSTKRDLDRKEQADIVEQDKLVFNRGRVVRLTDVFARPQVDNKRGLPGELQIHVNGLRYESPVRKEPIEIMFNNIKHLFFQPCDNEMIILIHIHLKNPVMIGKKKTKDIQFYREASATQFDETGGGKRRRPQLGDEDELQAEQDERRHRIALNKEFKSFADKISEASDGEVEVDVPLRELGFNGVPFRSNVLLQPTTDCLVHLSEPPFLVIPLTEIEIVHLERVQFGLKNFDIVFVFKDFTRAPVHVNTVPMSQLDNVKEWLDSVDVVFTEGPINLNWVQVMKTINEDPYQFFIDGGWDFLADSGDDDSKQDSESGSEFEMSGSDFKSDSSDDESNYDEDASEDEGSEEEDEDSGEDWDELEAKAKRSDERRNGGVLSDEDEGRHKSKKARR